MPVRKVSHRGGNVIGHFPSIKMKRMVAFESLIERDYLYLLDYEPHVEWFEEQPLTVKYRFDDKELYYTPDFHIVEAGRKVLVECKPLAFVDQEENRRKFRAARAWCADRGWTFRVVTDQDIRAGFRLENVKLLTRYARHAVEPATKGRIYAVLHSAQAVISVDDLARRITGTDFSVATAVILCMAFHHEIFAAMRFMFFWQLLTKRYLAFRPPSTSPAPAPSQGQASSGSSASASASRLRPLSSSTMPPRTRRERPGF